MVTRFSQSLLERRWAWVSGLVAITLLMSFFAARVGIDNAVDVWFVEGDPSLVTYHSFQKTFGNDEVVAIAVVDPKGVWRPDTLNTLYKLTAALEGLEGIRRVVGVPNARLVHSGDALDIRPGMSGPVDAAGAATLKALVEADPVLKDRLVMAKGTVAMLYAQMNAIDDVDAVRNDVLLAVDAQLKEHMGGLENHVAGIGVIYNALNVISQTEGGIFMGAAFLVIFVLLWPLFRSMLAVSASIGAVAAALVMTRGLYGLAGRDDNMVTMTLPVLVLIIGIADCIHILRYRASRPDEAPAKLLAHILQPCLFTTLTTMVGFAALATSKMAVVRDLGIFASAGIGLAFISSAICCAAVIASPRLTLKRPSDAESGWAGRFLAWTARFSIGNKEAILGGTCLVILLSAYGVSRVDVDTYSLGYLAEDHKVRTSSERLEALVGPYTPLEVVIRAKSGKVESIKDPTILRAVHALGQSLVKDDPQIRDAFSVADVTARMHQVHGGPGAAFEVPDDADLVATNLEIYTSDPDNEAAQLTDPAWKSLRLTLSVPNLSAKGYGALIQRVESAAQAGLPDTTSYEVSGYLPLYVKMMDYVVQSQVQSFGIAFVVVFLLIGLLFGSVRMTALAVLPNVLPVFVTLGAMGFAGIHLDAATVTITAIIIGIVVDDTIHYLHRFRAELARTGVFEEAALATALGCGRSIGATTLIFSLGFSILAFASVKSIAYFGVLTAFSMVVALLGDLLILPAVLLALKPRLAE